MAVAVALQENNIIGAEPNNNIWIETSCRRRIPAHYQVLVAESPVLESLVLNSQSSSGMSKPVIQILGVPYDAVLAFVTILYYKRDDGEHRDLMDEYAMYLMVLSHAYQVRWLKSRCERELAARLTVASVVDLLQLAKQCDAQRLYFRCMKLVHKDFASVEKTEGWIFLQNNDPLLELEILQFLNEVDKRRKRRRKLQDQRVYLQLSEAMDCLQHLCTDGCTQVCPNIDTDTPTRNKGSSCPSPKTCYALQLQFRHMASCRTNRIVCPRCRRMWNLLRLHSSICNLSDQCSVPLCKQFKLKMKQKEAKADDGKWELLAKKLVTIRVMSSFVKRKMHDIYAPQAIRCFVVLELIK